MCGIFLKCVGPLWCQRSKITAPWRQQLLTAAKNTAVCQGQWKRCSRQKQIKSPADCSEGCTYSRMEPRLKADTKDLTLLAYENICCSAEYTVINKLLYRNALGVAFCCILNVVQR